MDNESLIFRLRAVRAAAGKSQVELADEVGVSRQALSAIEAGRQTPSTALALALARALDCGVEDLFELPLARLTARLAAPSDGDRVAIGFVDDAFVAHPIADPSQPADGLVVSRARDVVAVEPFGTRVDLERNVLVAGCAPLLGLLSGRLERDRVEARATWLPASSGRALALLEQRSVHVAGIHLVAADEGHEGLVRASFGDRAMAIVNLTRWRQGLAVAPGNPRGIREPADLLRADVRVALREPDAGATRLLARHVDVAKLHGPLASGHAEVAMLVRLGAVDTGMCIEATAAAAGLDFIPIAEERFDLVVCAEDVERPNVARLFDALTSPTFRREAERARGYDLALTGHMVTV